MQWAHMVYLLLCVPMQLIMHKVDGLVNTEMKVNLDQLEIKAGDDVSPVLDEGESCAERMYASLGCTVPQEGMTENSCVGRGLGHQRAQTPPAG